MDAQSIILQMSQFIKENLSTSSFLDGRFTYDAINAGATEFVSRTHALTATQTITTVANQTNYDLNPDFLQLHMMDDRNRYFVKYYDGSGTTFIVHRDYDKIVYGNQTTAVAIPYNFSLVDKAALTSSIAGTATSTGTLTNGTSALNDTGAPFANVAVGDECHNTKDLSHGVVLTVTSTSSLVTALFGGTNAYWASSDTYVVVPQGRKQLVLDPPPSTSGHTVTVYYVQKPPPVYSPYGTFRFDPKYKETISLLSAGFYKLADSKPGEAAGFMQMAEAGIRRGAKENGLSLDKVSWRVNLNKRSYGDRSYR